jgi:hypothetical protein
LNAVKEDFKIIPKLRRDIGKELANPDKIRGVVSARAGVCEE